jgi:hypothetical protein
VKQPYSVHIRTLVAKSSSYTTCLSGAANN